MANLLLRLALFICIALAATVAPAHKASDSYLSVTVSDAGVQGQWDIALRDLDYAIGVDGDDNGEITWGEVKARQQEIAAYAMARLSIKAEGGVCPLKVTEQLVDEHSDGAYAVLRFVAGCAANPRSLELTSLEMTYQLFFDIDPQHRGLLRLQNAEQTQTTIFSPEAITKRFELVGKGSSLKQFLAYTKEGVWHIWIGFDHVLFLVSLLLPAVLVLSNKSWQPAARFGGAFLDVLKVVTAFTAAHSITLSLAALEVVSLPSRLVESLIALSVVLAALNNLYPLVHGRRWVVAFAFGLIHGFGFASVLVDLGLPKWALLSALLGFNVGVEIGQAAIVAVVLPLTFALRATWLYRTVVLRVGSWLIVAIAALWFAERAFNLSLIG